MSNFNLREMLAQAKNGNQDAMVKLVEYYQNIGDKDNEIHWDYVHKTCQYIAFTMLTIHMNELEILSALNIGAWDTLYDDCSTIISRTDEINEYYESGDIPIDNCNVQEIKTARENAFYGLAIVAYVRDDDTKSAIDLLLKSEQHSGKAKMLLGVCLYIYGNHVQAYHILHEAFADDRYRAEKKTKLEEMIFANGVFQLSTIYRIGLQGCTHPNLERAYEILNIGMHSVENDRIRDDLFLERRRYQKKLFGGLKYV